MPDAPRLIAVLNVSRSRGPVALDGGGLLPHGETGKAADTEHTAALIDAGHLIRVESAAERKAREKREAEAAANTTGGDDA